jgi:hypothetical protein
MLTIRAAVAIAAIEDLDLEMPRRRCFITFPSSGFMTGKQALSL